MNTATTVNFSFQLEELPKKLLSAAGQIPTGNCRLQLTVNHQGTQHSLWYLTIVQNRLVFSGTEPLSWVSFLALLKRHLPHLRTSPSQKKLIQVNQDSSPDELNQIGLMLKKLDSLEIITHEQVIKAIQTQLLTDFDIFLFQSAGNAEFTPEPELVYQAQIPGFKLEDLVARAKQRQGEWEAIRTRIPSMQCSPQLNQEAVRNSQLTDDQKRQIVLLTSTGETLAEIAEKMGNDPLELAKVFAKLVRSQLVTLEPPSFKASASAIPTILIVDDSPLIIQQFKTLVTSWGYRVITCQNPLNAVDQMLNTKPAKMFIDINMPGLSGFDLIKQIRRHPDLTSIPLVLLTAENSISNQWRAQWASCQFLAKPRSREEVPQFRTELRQLLPDLASESNPKTV